MASDHRAQVEELVADYRRSRDQLASMQQTLAAINESAASSDGTVVATVGGRGTLTDLTFSDDAYIRHRPSDLAKLVLRTVAAAVTKASETANRTVSPLLPVQTDPAALLAGRADLTEAELTPKRPVDEDSYEDVSWMDNPRRSV
ncbi:YbaB/EbfC family nucleoid-associated protein [Kibdelosporangium philippinense]|uniref:YbaB/EbfC family nucleoid-associated protein n=1 Tax=Kibdelosporangium philippinense TaxID=211113 RepID=A0ABS8ZDV0_9PSEU|nr:YbaB/EbfC family nucleoid-associated protein [Kibdelosporangium philippinense]MCE7006015.1 YbaB/EbfC family nucleoid-associated protein [Kibdelosporangium philippinense]